MGAVDEINEKVVAMKRFFAGAWSVILQVWGMFCGGDGKLSMRRLAGTGCLFVGVHNLTQVSFRGLPDGEVTPWILAYSLGPGILITLVGLWIWQWISEQNIKSMTEGFRK